MDLEITGAVVENDPGAQVYFTEQFADPLVFPFEPGEDEFRAINAVEHDAIVLVRADRDLEFPLTLTITDPESYHLSIIPTDDTPDMTPDSSGTHPGTED